MRWLREHPRVADGALGAVLLVLCLLPAISRQYDADATGTRDLHAAGVVLLALTTLPLAWRRSHPVHVAAVIAASAVAYEAIGQPDTANGVAGLVAVYSASAWGSKTVSRIAAAVTAVALTGILALNFDQDSWSWLDLVGNYAIFATAWVLGDNVRQRRERLRNLEERAVIAEMNREEEARRAVAAERTRIARELHDVVAHSVSVMVVQAGAARRVLERNPEQAAEAMASIEAVGRQSLNEMRRLLGVLRRDDDRSFGRVPQPSMQHVDVLVDQTREAGLSVELVVEGDPKPLAAGVDLSAYRIVQEALTNTLKHAGPDVSAEVRLCYGDGVVELVVSDDGRGSDRERTADHGGHGLVGMQERVSLFGGELHVGNRPGGGFLVRARLPLEVQS